MRTTISILLTWAITSAFATDPPIKNSVSESTKVETGFTLVKQKNDIRIFTRWIPVNEKRSARQVKVEFTINAQDCIIHYHVRKNSATYTEVLLHGEPDYLAPVKGVKRISHMQGSWKLLAVSPNRTVIEYMIFSNQPSSFPKWITDPIIQNNMIHTMSAFREQVTSN